jgi:hypothetical protein
MTDYPKVIGAQKTLEAVLAGKSLTRYGDGEFRLAAGGVSNVSQTNDPKLQRELKHILLIPQSFCLVGVPDMDPHLIKYERWKKYKTSYPRLMNQSTQYYSAFISRPDSDQTIDVPEFYDRLEDIWRDREVVLVRGSERSLVEGKGPMLSAARTHPVLCDRRDAYAQIDDLEQACIDSPFARVILCAGPAATCLAWRLSPKKHAIDLGHVGMFWRAYENRKSALFQGA